MLLVDKNITWWFTAACSYVDLEFCFHVFLKEKFIQTKAYYTHIILLMEIAITLFVLRYWLGHFPQLVLKISIF